MTAEAPERDTLTTLVKQYVENVEHIDRENMFDFVQKRLSHFTKAEILSVTEGAVRERVGTIYRLIVLNAEKEHTFRKTVARTAHAAESRAHGEDPATAIEPLLSLSVWEPLAFREVPIRGKGMVCWWDLTDDDAQSRIDEINLAIGGMQETVTTLMEYQKTIANVGTRTLREAITKGLIA